MSAEHSKKDMNELCDNLPVLNRFSQPMGFGDDATDADRQQEQDAWEAAERDGDKDMEERE